MELQNEHKPRKRVVSKSRYATQVGGKVLATSAGTLIVLGGLLSCFTALTMAFLVLSGELHTGSKPYFLLMAALFFCGGVRILWRGWKYTRAVVKNPLDAPLTRSTQKQLSPEESLVRGASESTQEQRAVLLRAAQPYDTTPAEQLLRVGPPKANRE